MSAKVVIKEILKYIVIGLLIIFVLFPVYYLLLFSLLSSNSIKDSSYDYVIREWNWSNFGKLFDKQFFEALFYTFVFASTLILLRLITYSLAIAGLLKMKPLLQKIFQYFFLLISLVPEFSIFLSLKITLNDLRISSIFFTTITNAIFSFFSFTYVFNLAKSTSNKKSKLMINDNLRWYQKIIYVYLPKLKLAYFLMIFFTFITVWNDYLWPVYILQGTNIQNITIWYRNIFVTSGGALINIQAAGAVISIVIPLTIYGIFAKKINRFN